MDRADRQARPGTFRALKAATFYPHEDRDESFRNPAGVSRKAQNVLSEREDHVGAKTHSSHLDAEVLADFLDRPDEMQEAARLIRAAIANGTGDPHVNLMTSDDFTAREGRVLLARHLRRERNPKLRRRKLASILKAGHQLSCEACAFNFAESYGPRGEGYIEVHHVVPLHIAGEGETRLSDLALLCSNCHRMVHRSKDWLTIAELKDLVEAN